MAKIDVGMFVVDSIRFTMKCKACGKKTVIQLTQDEKDALATQDKTKRPTIKSKIKNTMAGHYEICRRKEKFETMASQMLSRVACAKAQ